MEIKLDIQKVINEYNTHKSALKVSQLNNCSEPTILKLLHKHNISVHGNRKNDAVIPCAIHDIQNKVSINVVCRKYSLHKKYLIKILNERNIEYYDYPKKIALSPKRIELVQNIKQVEESYIKNRFSVPLTIKQFGCTLSDLKIALNYCKIPLRNQIEENKKKTEPFKDTIITKYKLNTSIGNLSRTYNVPTSTIKDLLLKEGVVLRSKSEATRIENNKPEHQRKALKSAFRNKKYILPSTKAIYLQGYEPQFLDFIFSNNLLLEDEIVYEPTPVQYNIDQKYYPDFYIPKFNLIVEIKSTYTLSQTNPLKFTATRDAGFNLIIVVDNNFDEITTYINSNVKRLFQARYI